MRVNKLLKRISAGLLAALTVVSLVPQGGGLTSSSTVSAANVASGVEGTLGSVDINGYDTMYDYIKSDFTYTDQMTVNDYKDTRSASYDRNETSTGKNSVDYLLQSVEWTDVDNGEALLSVAGKDTTDSVALYVFTTCLANDGFTGNTVKQNLIDLLQFYDRVDCICIDNGWAWALLSDRRTIGGDKYGTYNNVFTAGGTGRNDDGNNTCYHTVGKAKGGQSKTYAGIQPYVSFYQEDYSTFAYKNCQVATDVTNYLNAFEWVGGRHDTDMYLSAIKAYMMGDFSFKTWNCANNYNLVLHDSANGNDGTNISPVDYQTALYDVLLTDFDITNVENVPTAVYIECSDFGEVRASDADAVNVGNDKEFVQFLADEYCNSSDYKWFTLQAPGVNSLSKSSTTFSGGSSTRAAQSSADADDRVRCALAALNPKYTVENWDKLANKTSYSFNSSNYGINNSQYRYSYATPFKTGGIRMPDKQLAFDIPIGNSWQADFQSISKPNIVYTYKYKDTSSKAGQYCTTSGSGTALDVTTTIDANNVIHITTDTYVKGAEISIQIPLKYSANGVQSAKQLRTDENGHVYTDGKSGTPVADTYVISMTSGDTKLHVGPDILGDLDTALSIYMPSSDLMDVQVNLHWMNDSDTIKGMLGDTSVRGNATALIGSDALVGTMLGKQSDDDEKAGGIGTSVVAMNFANANGSVGTIASSYTDSDGITKQLSNSSVDLQLRTKNGAPDLWTDAKDEAGENNVVTYMMFNVPRFGHPTANTYDANGNVTGVTDLADGVVPRYYYVEDVVNVPAGYTAYNITNMASSDLEKLQKAIGTDTENPMTYNNALYYAYTVTPPSDWNSPSKVTYTIDCYVALDIKSLKMTVEHYQEQLTGDGYTPSTNKQYKLESSIDSYEAITSVYSPEVKTYAGYDSPDRQSLTVTVTGDRVIKYYYDLHYYDINVDTQGGEWYEEQDDGTWNAISEPPAHYTILTPTFTLPIPDKVGFDFEGYTGTGLSKVTHDVTIEKGTTGDKAYKANWLAQAYDVEVPVSLIFSASYDGIMKGAFDQNGSGKVTKTGFLLNNSKFPVQVTHITYNNDSVYTMSDVKSDEPNIMNWRLDATNGTHTYNTWATALDDTVDVSNEETYWMAQNSEGKVILDSDQAWYRNDVPDIKDTTKIGNIVWTFGIGHRNVVERPIVAAK